MTNFLAVASIEVRQAFLDVAKIIGKDVDETSVVPVLAERCRQAGEPSTVTL